MHNFRLHPHQSLPHQTYVRIHCAGHRMSRQPTAAVEVETSDVGIGAAISSLSRCRARPQHFPSQGTSGTAEQYAWWVLWRVGARHRSIGYAAPNPSSTLTLVRPCAHRGSAHVSEERTPRADHAARPIPSPTDRNGAQLFDHCVQGGGHHYDRPYREIATVNSLSHPARKLRNELSRLPRKEVPPSRLARKRVKKWCRPGPGVSRACLSLLLQPPGLLSSGELCAPSPCRNLGAPKS